MSQLDYDVMEDARSAFELPLSIKSTRGRASAVTDTLLACNVWMEEGFAARPSPAHRPSMANPSLLVCPATVFSSCVRS